MADVFKILSTNTSTNSVNGKAVIRDVLIVHFKTLCAGVRRNDLDKFESLICSVRELLWYLGPHYEKFNFKGFHIPKPISQICDFNNPKRHKHAKNDTAHDVLDRWNC